MTNTLPANRLPVDQAVDQRPQPRIACFPPIHPNQEQPPRVTRSPSTSTAPWCHTQTPRFMWSIAAKYGANVFDGVCAYAGEGELSFVFRAQEHRAVRLEATTLQKCGRSTSK
jgi:hypothetical protein